MSSKYYLGENHIFTSRSENPNIIMKTGTDEALTIQSNGNLNLQPSLYTAMNGHMSNNSYGLVSGNGAFSLSAGALTHLDATYFDNIPEAQGDNVFDRVSYVAGDWLIKKDGIYMCTFNANFKLVTGATVLEGFIAVNDNTTPPAGWFGYNAAYSSSSSINIITCNAILKLSTNDTVQPYVRCNGAVSSSTVANGYFTIYRLQ